ncbi:unnamed protein product [Acanthocheilonema viteae]|uniref:Transmembrane protein 188 n=1 Tax=Acanthocheilonema viteae TaxID=6277 RepID=A0A498S1Y3_ACAVI|nr:unnamed protein product [Acanthocheilonema viteae]
MIAIRAIIIAIIATGRPLNFQPVPKLPIPFIQPCFLVIYLPELLTLETSCCEYGEGLYYNRNQTNAETRSTLARSWMRLLQPVKVTLVESLQNHLVFSACVPSLLFLFGFIGIHNRAVAPSIIASRCRSVLADFSLSCDDSGKLIVRPPHRVHVSP